MTNVPWHLRKLVGMIGVISLVAVIAGLSKNKGFDVGLYDTEVAVALTVITISILFWTFKPDFEKIGLVVKEHDKKIDRIIDEKRKEEAKEHRKKLNDEFLRRRAQIFTIAFTWEETFRAFADAKEFLQHIATGHPELYGKMKNLMEIEIEYKKIPKPIPANMKNQALELKQKEDQGRMEVRNEFDDLQSRIRQETEDIGGICKNCIKFYNKNDSGFKELKKRLDSFIMPF